MDRACIVKLPIPPEDSIIGRKFGPIDYSESYRAAVHCPISVDEITTRIFSLPGWIQSLLKFRDFVGRGLGLQTVAGHSPTPALHYGIGSKAILFTVIDRNENEIVMEEKDKHLDFRTSVYLEKGVPAKLYWSTVIQYHNFFGRLYFLLVKPIHQAVVKHVLKQVVGATTIRH